MDKVKDVLHLRRKSKPDVPPHHGGSAEPRESYDSELESMTPEERVKYLKEFDYAEKHGEPKKGSFLDKLIARGNKKTEDQIAEENAAKAGKGQASEGVIR